MQSGAAAIRDARQHDAQFAVRQPGARLRAVDRGVDPDRAREASEVTLDQVKAGRSALREIGPFLLADDQQHAGLEEDANRVRGDAGQVEDDLDGLFGLEDIDDRHAFAGDGVPPIGASLRQVVEQAMDVLGEISRLVH